MDWIAMATHYTKYSPRFSYITGMARAFADWAPTVYVNQPIGWYQALVRRERTGIIQDLDPLRVRIFQPYTWRENSTQDDRRRNMRTVGRSLRPILKGRGLFWLHTPEHLSMAQVLDDTVTACSFGDGGEAGEPDRWRILEQSDYVLPVSLPLYEICAAHFPEKTFFVPCGIDTSRYSATGYTEGSHDSGLIRELRQSQVPVILYYGGVNSRLSFTLLYYLANRLKGLEFVVAGPIDAGFKIPYLTRCRDRQNITFTGSLSLEEYHALLELSSVCLIPFELKETTLYANPLKLYHYWSFGRPVVSSFVPTYRVFGDLIWMANDFEEFAEGIERGVEEHDSERERLRREIAQLHDTANLAAAVRSIVEEEGQVPPDLFLQRIRGVLREGEKA